MALLTNVGEAAKAIKVIISAGGFNYTQGRTLKFKAKADNGGENTTII